MFWELVDVSNNRFCGLDTHRWNNNKLLDHHSTTLICLVPWLFGGWIFIRMKILHPTYTCLICVFNTWHSCAKCAKCANTWKNNFPVISITKSWDEKFVMLQNIYFFHNESTLIWHDTFCQSIAEMWKHETTCQLDFSFKYVFPCQCAFVISNSLAHGFLLNPFASLLKLFQLNVRYQNHVP
jgi:hypothetical protein